MQNIAATLIQPIMSFIFPVSTPPDKDEAVAGETRALTLGIHWFMVARKIPLCGHRLLVSTHLIFSGAMHSHFLSALAPSQNINIASLHTLNFVSGLTHHTSVAWRTTHPNSECVEIVLPVVRVEPVPDGGA
jgi:hypothetical protein